MLDRIRNDGDVSYQHFTAPDELMNLVENDLAVLLSERFALARASDQADEPAWTLPSSATPLLGREQEAGAARDLVVCWPRPTPCCRPRAPAGCGPTWPRSHPGTTACPSCAAS